jgi:hypothetical protein
MKDAPLVPFVLGHGAWCDERAARCPLPGCEIVDVLAPAHLPFFRLVNAGNAVAYGGTAMPAWVQLDCACLPSGMIGFAARRADVDDALWAKLVTQVRASFGVDAAAALDGYDGLVPLTEYACVPTPEDGHVVGFSLYSLRKGLGTRTKAMALLMCGATRQTGVTQVNNSALRTHTLLGPLDVIAPRVTAHSDPVHTFVYALRVPSSPVLQGIALGNPAPPRRTGSVRIAIGDETTERMALLLETDGPHAIVDVEHGVLVLSPAG